MILWLARKRLHSEDIKIRASAVESIGRKNTETRRNLLFECFADPSSSVRASVAKALTKFNSTEIWEGCDSITERALDDSSLEWTRKSFDTLVKYFRRAATMNGFDYDACCKFLIIFLKNATQMNLENSYPLIHGCFLHKACREKLNASLVALFKESEFGLEHRGKSLLEDLKDAYLVGFLSDALDAGLIRISGIGAKEKIDWAINALEKLAFHQRYRSTEARELLLDLIKKEEYTEKTTGVFRKNISDEVLQELVNLRDSRGVVNGSVQERDLGETINYIQSELASAIQKEADILREAFSCSFDHASGSFSSRVTRGDAIERAKVLSPKLYWELLDALIQDTFRFGCPLSTDCRSKLILMPGEGWRCVEHGDVYKIPDDHGLVYGDLALKKKVSNIFVDPKILYWGVAYCYECKKFSAYWSIEDVQNHGKCRNCGYETSGPFA